LFILNHLRLCFKSLNSSMTPYLTPSWPLGRLSGVLFIIQVAKVDTRWVVTNGCLTPA